MLKIGKITIEHDKIDANFMRKRLVFLVLIGTLCTIILPASLAWWDHVFIDSQLREAINGGQINSDANTKLKTLKRFEDEQLQYSNWNTLLVVTNLFKQTLPVNFEENLKFEEEKLNDLKPKITLAPFYPFSISRTNGNAQIWFFCFGFLLFAMPPFFKFQNGWSFKLLENFWPFFTWFVLAIFLQCWYFFNIWFRNFYGTNGWNDGRTIYAYCNLDVSPKSFGMSQLIDTINLVFIMLLCLKNYHIYIKIRERLQDYLCYPDYEFGYATNPENIAKLSTAYSRWQISSVMIGIPCLLQTYFYYGPIIKDGDTRYITQAINCQLIWAVTWIIASLPLHRQYHLWSKAKTYALLQIVHGNYQTAKRNLDEFELKSKVLEKIKPFSAVSFLFSAVASAVSFLLPLLQGFWK